MTVLFSGGALLAAALTFAAMLALQYHLIVRGEEAELRALWADAVRSVGRLERRRMPPNTYAAQLDAGGRTYLAKTANVAGLEQVFLKPYYGRRGQRADGEGFWLQAIETGRPRRRFRVCAKPLPDGTLLAVAQGLEVYDGAFARAIAMAGLGFALMAALQLILGDFFARRLLVGFPELVDAVDAMASGDFSRRVRSLGPDEELTRLADAVNQMAANTEGLLAELKAVTDNVAHDLRTPITRLRARAELAMRTGRTAKLPGEVAEECDGLLRFIATALCVSRLSHGLDVGESVEADAARLAEELAELYAVSAEMRRVALVCDLPAGEGCPCVLNVPLVRRAKIAKA